MSADYTSADGTLEVYANLGVMYSFDRETKPKLTVDTQATQVNSNKIHVWGDDNNFPQEIMAELAKNSDLTSFLDLQARALHAGGVTYRIIDPNTGEEKPGRRPEIDRFLFKNWYYPIQATVDFYRFINVFPEFGLKKNREKIDWLICRPANECRYELQDSNGRINRVYVSANWPEARIDDLKTFKVPVVNPLYDDPEQVKLRKDGTNYIYPLSYPSGKVYYQIANWNSIRNNKWLELANKIPEFKLALMQNQLTIKYHIQISGAYWKWKYEGKWETFSAEEKKKRKEETIATINTFLKGEKNAGKSLTTHFEIDQVSGKEIPGIKIEAVDDKIKDGIYLEDSVEATIKLFSALGLDPSILGIVPGKGGSNRSGSDKREALNIYISLIQPHANIILRPYEFISWYNGWNNDNELIEWRFKAPLLQTLDQVTPSKRETVPEEEGGGDGQD